jgi:hypothetical protein
MALIQRVESFEVGVAQSPGNDLQKILWLKSSNSEVFNSLLIVVDSSSNGCTEEQTIRDL